MLTISFHLRAYLRWMKTDCDIEEGWEKVMIGQRDNRKEKIKYTTGPIQPLIQHYPLQVNEGDEKWENEKK